MHEFLFAALVLAIGAVAALLLPGNRTRGWIALTTQGIAAVAVWVTIAPVLAGGAPWTATLPWAAPIGDVPLRIDGLGAFFLAWSLPMTWLGTLYAQGYLGAGLRAGRNGGPHYALLNLTALSFVIVYSVQNALAFLLGWEIAAVAAWLLVIWDYGNQKVRFAGFNYLVSTQVGLFVLVAAFMLLHGRTGAMDFAAFGTFLQQPDPQRSTIFLLLGVAFALKAAFFPFHTWLPRAHAAAPAHVSALMSGVIHKAGLFGFLRFALLLGPPEEWMGWTVLLFGALSAFAGVLYTVAQRDLKRLLGYSSTENVGIAAMGFGVGCLGWTWQQPAMMTLGFGAGLLHLFHHAVFKCLLFYAAGAIHRAVHTVDIERLGGLARVLPYTATWFLVGAVAIAGLPPLNGFVGEFLLFQGLFTGGVAGGEPRIALVAMACVLAFVGGVGALAMTRAFGLTFLGVARQRLPAPPGDAPASMAWPMALHAVAAVGLGLVPSAGLWLIGGALQSFPGARVDTVATALTPATWLGRGLAVVLLLFGVLAWWRGRARRRSPTWGCGYNAVSVRMQYTGASFAEHFGRLFAAFLTTRRREQLPTAVFPSASGRLQTQPVDAVEQRIFEVLGRGDAMVTDVAERVPERPRLAFLAGLLVLLLLGAWLLGGLGR
ncbi:MAG: proton-conducting membrane transporter [Planctomycetes bacterium]|nr:proton-conducting membrane transporter [Planctomycetota bacterium]